MIALTPEDVASIGAYAVGYAHRVEEIVKDRIEPMRRRYADGAEVDPRDVAALCADVAELHRRSAGSALLVAALLARRADDR